MSKEMTKKETQGLSTTVTPVAHQEILNTDIVIPRLTLAQGLSDAVKARKAQMGDFVRSGSMEVVGNAESRVEIIPLKMTTDWVIQEIVKGKPEYRKTIQRNAANEDLPWEFEENGTPHKRVKVINLFGLLKSDVEKYQAEMKRVLENGEIPDLNLTLLPVVLSFRSTSYNAGKEVATFFAKVRDMTRFSKDVAPYKYTLSIGAHEDSNEHGDFYVLEVGKTAKLPDALVEEALRWYGHLNAMKEIKVEADQGEDEDTRMREKAEKINDRAQRQF